MRTILIEASPWNPATGAVVPVALAGGGVRAYRHRGRNDWIAGVANEPRFSARIAFDEDGFSGGARVEFGVLQFAPDSIAKLNSVAGLLWKGAAIEVLVGDDELAAPVWSTLIKGEVETMTVAGAAISFRIRDATAALDKAVASDRFTGTGGLEGDDFVEGRVKRRAFGWCGNVEAQPLKASTNIYEVGDPNVPLFSIPDVRDMGRSAGSLVVVGWQGTAAATLAALEAASAPQGGGAVAPSIACVKWWTQPVGPLTADIRGTLGTGLSDRPARLAEAVIAARSTLTISNAAAAAGWRDSPAGVYVENSSETVAQVLDRLLKGVSLGWNATAAGVIVLSEFKFTGPIETLKATEFARAQQFKPLTRRRVGYRRNYRQHNDSEIAATLRDGNGEPLTSGAIFGVNVFESDGVTPAAQADYETAVGISAGFLGMGSLATKNAVGWASDVEGRPFELTDGRVGLGLAANGDVARSIPGSRLEFSPANMLLDPRILDASAWPVAINSTVDSAAPELATLGVARAWKHLPASGSAQIQPKIVPAIPGASYTASLRIFAKAGANASVQAAIRFFDRAGAYLAQATKTLPLGSPAADTAFDLAVSGVAPAGTAFVSVVMFAAAWTTGIIWTSVYAIRPVSTPALVNLGDTANMIPDADFLDAATTWGAVKAVAMPNSTAGKGAGVNRLVFNSATGTETVQTARIACGPGETLRASCYIETESGATGNLLIAPQFYNAAGVPLSYGTYVLYANGETGRYTATSKAPANTAFVTFNIVNYGGGNRVWSISEPLLYRAAVLNRSVVREDGTTPITDALAVTSLGISAGFIGMGSLATKNNVGWSSDVVGRPLELTDGRIVAGLDASGDLARNITTTRANLSALLRYAGGGLFTGELAADITSTHTAAGIAGQTAWATYAALPPSRLEGIEPAADVTSSITGVAEVVISADYTGVPLDGQLPKSVPYRLIRQGVDVSTAASWSRTVVNGTVTCTIGAATGMLSITAIATDSVVRISAVYGATTRTFDVKVSRSLANPPATGSGGGGTAASVSSFSSIASTSMQTITTELTVTVGAAGNVDLAATTTFDFEQLGGIGISYQSVYLVWQRWNGASWVDLSTEAESATPARRSASGVDDEGPGFASLAQQVTGLTAGSSQKFRLRGRGSTAKSTWFYGSSASAQG